MTNTLNRRRFLTVLGGTVLAGCSESPSQERYSEEDIALLAAQRQTEAENSGKSPYGVHRYQGYRGLAELPWFELDKQGQLVCVDESIPMAIDVHCHLGMSVLFKPQLDLQKKTSRVKHLLDCDAAEPGCELDLDVYVNSNFSQQALTQLRRGIFAQGFWGSSFAETQTIPNLLAEMDAMRVEQSMILPIKLGLPFGDDQTETWRVAIEHAKVADRLKVGFSINPDDEDCLQHLRAHAESGVKLMKLHPPLQKFYPDDHKLMPIYELAQELGVIVFFHGGRAGIEPESSRSYAMPRHYEAALANFPGLQFILGHAGARDGAAMLDLALQYDNAWIGIHGQGISWLDEMIRRTGGHRLLFGTDWPFYHIGASLAKVLIVTQRRERNGIRERILRSNAIRLFG